MAPRHLLMLFVAIFNCSNGFGQFFPQYTLLSPPFLAPYFNTGENSLMTKSSVQGLPYEKRGKLDIP